MQTLTLTALAVLTWTALSLVAAVAVGRSIGRMRGGEAEPGVTPETAVAVAVPAPRASLDAERARVGSG